MGAISNLGKKTAAVVLSLSLMLYSGFGTAAAVYYVPGHVGKAPVGNLSAGAAGAAAANVLAITHFQTQVPGAGSRLSLDGNLVDVETPVAELGQTQSVALSGVNSISAADAQAIEKHPVLGIINDLQKAGVQVEDSPRTTEEYKALEEAIERNVPEGRGKQNMLAFAKSLSAGGNGGALKMAAAFDGNGMRDGKYVMPVAETSRPSGFWNWLAGNHKKVGLLGRLRGYAARKAETQRVKAGLIDKDALKVPVEKLRWVPNAEELPEKLTDLEGGPSGIVGQDRAIESIRFGLEMDDRSYNLIVTGEGGTGRKSALRQELAKIAPKMDTPPDMVAATNFHQPSKPVVLTLNSGSAPTFQGAVRQIVGRLKQVLPAQLLRGPIADKKEQMHKAFKEAEAAAMEKFDAEVAKVKHGRYGIRFVQQEEGQFDVAVTVDGKLLTPENIDALIEKEAKDESVTDKVSQEKLMEAQKAMGEDIQRLGKALQELMGQLSQAHQQVHQRMAQIDSQVVQQVMQQFGEALLPFARDEAHAAFAKRAMERQASLDEEISKVVILEKFGIQIDIEGGKLMAAPTWSDPQRAAQLAKFAKMPGGGGALMLAVAGGAQAIGEKEFNQLKEAGQVPAEMTWKRLNEAVVAKAKELLPKYQEMGKANQKDQEALPKPTAESRKTMGYVKMLLTHMAQNYELFMPQQQESADQERIAPEKVYKVSVLANNKPGSGAPVIFEMTPTFGRIFGEGKEASRLIQKGAMTIKAENPGGPTLQAGSYVRANGGYLVLNLMDVLREPGVYQSLMQMIRNGRAVISEGGVMSLYTMQGDHYEVPSNVKVVLVGSPYLKMMLSHHDEDFAGLFRAAAEFERTLEIGAEAMNGYLKFMRAMVEQSAGKIMDFARDAIGAVFETAAQYAQSNTKVTAQFGVMRALMLEATYWAKKAGREQVTREDVDKAISERVAQGNAMRRRIKEMFTSDMFHIAIEGKEVGQINGLAVMGDFGVPARITFEDYVRPGANFMVSTDQQSHSTGNSFDKSIANIRGFMGRTFGKKRSVPIEVSVSFEQNYGGIDGDSATQTMIYGILSTLSNLPINQGIAITGSTDQKGNVQVIGGVNQKIEGYFDVVTEKLAKEGRVMDGKQGIIIPSGNVGDLTLRPDIVEAVKQGKFVIYAVDHVSQGVEILMETPYSEVVKKVNERISEAWASAGK